MARCSFNRGVWVVKQCENAAFTKCVKCGNTACTDHLTVNSKKEFTCINCLNSTVPLYAVEDFTNGEVENYLYYMAYLKRQLDALTQDFNPIKLESLYNFTKYDSLSFRQEYIQYYDDNDTSGNLYDS